MKYCHQAVKEIEIELSCAEDVVARFDPLIIEQAIVNLIDNAIKYSSEGKTVWVEALQSENEIIISVRVDKKSLDNILFQPGNSVP